jgi:hypothetical protein
MEALSSHLVHTIAVYPAPVSVPVVDLLTGER